VTEPCLELEKGHRFFRVEQLGGNRCPRSVACDASTCIFEWHTGLGAEQGDQSPVEVRRRDLLTAEGEEQCNGFARPTIDQVRSNPKTRMTITSRFASIADMEQVIAIGQDEGMALAVGQIDAILAAPTKP
jgi:hypothetical protein